MMVLKMKAKRTSWITRINGHKQWEGFGAVSGTIKSVYESGDLDPNKKSVESGILFKI
jgi:hypothetical protein